MVNDINNKEKQIDNTRRKRVFLANSNMSSSINALEDELMTKIPAAMILMAAKISKEPIIKVLQEYLIIEGFLDEKTKESIGKMSKFSIEKVKERLKKI
ncbi:MAG: hypothetical protein K0B02_01675 [DPANN group archaeon]|nr:hypothetical protein [DPANN group archaeon]